MHGCGGCCALTDRLARNRPHTTIAVRGWVLSSARSTAHGTDSASALCADASCARSTRCNRRMHGRGRGARNGRGRGRPRDSRCRRRGRGVWPDGHRQRAKWRAGSQRHRGSRAGRRGRGARADADRSVCVTTRHRDASRRRAHRRLARRGNRHPRRSRNAGARQPFSDQLYMD